MAKFAMPAGLDTLPKKLGFRGAAEEERRGGARATVTLRDVPPLSADDIFVVEKKIFLTLARTMEGQL
jgi:hypothetical protein